MFDQTFVPAGQTAKPASLLLSLTIQLAAITALVLASIVYTQALPFGQLHALLIAPRPPLPPHARVPSAAKTPLTSAFNPTHLQILPVRISPPQHSLQTLAPAIDPGIFSSATESSSELNGIIGAPLSGVAQPPAPPTSKPNPPAGPIRVGGSVAAANLIEKVVPPYPHLAAVAGVSGTVEFSAIIDREGRVTNLKLLHGHPLLVRAATEAVLQWRYRPTLLNGVPVEVATDITVKFNLSSR